MRGDFTFSLEEFADILDWEYDLLVFHSLLDRWQWYFH